MDNLVNSLDVSVDRVKEITGKPTQIEFVKVDLCDKEALAKVFAKRTYEGVIHFAALKAVGESVQKPLASRCHLQKKRMQFFGGA